ncbi:MAG TPA: polysaccharide biosynthesis C-terminal domain-containing protein [Rhizomicrobium sp.]
MAIRAAGAVFGFAFNVVLSRELGVAGTGVVMFYLNSAALTGLVATGGMDVVGLRELSRHGDDPSRPSVILGHLVSNALLSALVLSACGFLVLFLFGGKLTGSFSLGIDVACALILFFSAFQKIFSDWLVAFRDFAASQLSFYFINRVASLGLAVAVIALAGTASAGFFIFAYAAGLLLAVLYAFGRVVAHVSWREIFGKLSLAMPMIRDGIACTIQNSAYILLNLSPFLLLATLSNTIALALFGISQRLVAVIVLALTAISQFAMRDFSLAFGTSDFGALARALTTSIRLTFAASIALVLPLVAFAPFWVLIFGKGFAEAAPVLILLSVGICAQCLGMPFQAALFATNNERAARNVTLVCAAVGILSEVLLIPSWGALGAALGMGIGLAFQSAGHALCVLRLLPVRLEFAVLRVVPAAREN